MFLIISMQNYFSRCRLFRRIVDHIDHLLLLADFFVILLNYSFGVSTNEVVQHNLIKLYLK